MYLLALLKIFYTCTSHPTDDCPSSGSATFLQSDLESHISDIWIDTNRMRQWPLVSSGSRCLLWRWGGNIYKLLRWGGDRYLLWRYITALFLWFGWMFDKVAQWIHQYCGQSEARFTSPHLMYCIFDKKVQCMCFFYASTAFKVT